MRANKFDTNAIGTRKERAVEMSERQSCGCLSLD